jgi:hypothetical protein
VVLAELLEAAVQVADVRRHPHHALAVEFEHDAQRRMGGGVLRTEVEHPAIGRVDVILEVLDRLDVDVVAFDWLDGVRHRRSVFAGRGLRQQPQTASQAP